MRQLNDGARQTALEAQIQTRALSASVAKVDELQKGYDTMKIEFSSLSKSVNNAVALSRACSGKMASIEAMASQVQVLQQSSSAIRAEFNNYKWDCQTQVSSVSGLKEKVEYLQTEIDNLKGRQGHPAPLDSRLLGNARASPDGSLTLEKFEVSSVSGLKEKVDYLQTEIDNLKGRQDHTAPLDSRPRAASSDGLLTLEKLQAIVVETRKDMLHLKRAVNNTGQYSWKTSHPGRMSPIAEPSSSILPSTGWDLIVPTRGTLYEFRQNPAIQELVPEIVSICDDIESKLQEVKYDDEAMASARGMDDNELCGILGYTHDLCQPFGKKQGNLYFELNNDLRLRDVEGRSKMMARWGVTVHYTLKGLSKLPDFEGVVLRVLPDKSSIVAEYKVGRPIMWGAFVSTTTDITSAKAFGDKLKGIIARITVVSGKQLGKLSFFPCEGDVLLGPMIKFVVASAPYEEDGWWFIDLTEQKGKTSTCE